MRPWRRHRSICDILARDQEVLGTVVWLPVFLHLGSARVLSVKVVRGGMEYYCPGPNGFQLLDD
jgi:hypothetical protein